MEQHCRLSVGADDHVFRLCPRRDDRGVRARDNYVHARSQQHLEVAFGIRAKAGDHPISPFRREAGAERRLTRHVNPAHRLDGTAGNGPDKRSVAGCRRNSATRCPAGQGQGDARCCAHGHHHRSLRLGKRNHKLPLGSLHDRLTLRMPASAPESRRSPTEQARSSPPKAFLPASSGPTRNPGPEPDRSGRSAHQTSPWEITTRSPSTRVAGPRR